MLNLLGTTINDFRASRVRSQSRNRVALAGIPATLYPYWKRTAHIEFEGIPQDAFFFACASDGLLTFFGCVAHSAKACALPSKAADSVWHAWLQMDPASLDAFCRRYFGRAIAHLEAGAMPLPMEAALANCLVQARKREGINPEGPHLPRLFALDRRLRMPGGFSYAVKGGDVVFAHIDAAGRPERELHLQAGLAPLSLLAAGLIYQHEYVRFEEHRRPDSACGSTGSSCGSMRCDAGGGDGGGDGGGCGGGCGGD